MRVRCTKLVSPVDGSPLTGSVWVKVGREYQVLGILADPRGRVRVQVLDDDTSPSYWPAEMFEATDERLPDNWVARLDDRGVLRLAPASWLRAGFWEDYFDGRPDAMAQFERELPALLHDDT